MIETEKDKVNDRISHKKETVIRDMLNSKHKLEEFIIALRTTGVTDVETHKYMLRNCIDIGNKLAEIHSILDVWIEED